MEHLLENWDSAKELFISPIFLLLDYDGTLSPIRERHGYADLPKGTRNKIARLVSYCPVGIMSGRALDDLKDRVNIERVYYSGNHGYEIEGPRVSFVKEEAKETEEVIGEICDKVEEKSDSIEGVLVENKGYTASVHYRLLEEGGVSKLERVLDDVVAPYVREGLVEVNYGKKVFEIHPAVDWDKGKAVSLLLRVVGLEEETLPVYLGDDVTDEDAFFALKKRGVGVLVSEEERESAAQFRLRGPDEVGVFLGKLLGLLESV